MKKFISVMLCIMVVFSSATIFAADISVYVNGVMVLFDTEPEIVNGRTMVPLRAISEALGVEPIWNAENSSISINHNGVQTIITIGSDTALRQEEGKVETKQLDAAPYLKDGRTMVPLRFIAEALNKNVEWEGSTSTVRITDKRPPLIIPQQEETKISIGLKTPEEEMVFVLQRITLPSFTKGSAESDGSAFSAALMQAPEMTFANMLTIAWLDSAANVVVTNIMKTNPTRGNQLLNLAKNGNFDAYYDQALAEGKNMGYNMNCPIDNVDFYGYDEVKIFVVGTKKGWNFTDNTLLCNYVILAANGNEIKYYTVSKEFGFITVCEDISTDAKTITRIVKMFRDSENVTSEDLSDAVYEDMTGNRVVKEQPQIGRA